MEYPCDKCGAMFSSPVRNRYLCETCFKARRAAQQHITSQARYAKARPEHAPMTCQYPACGKTFTPKDNRQVYCDANCRNEYRRELHRIGEARNRLKRALNRRQSGSLS